MTAAIATVHDRYCACDTCLPPAQVTAHVGEVHRRADGRAYAVSLRLASPCVIGDVTVRLRDGSLSWATRDVWARPELYNLERYFCPGHDGQACQYGACDGIRFREIDQLREIVARRAA